MEDTIAKAATLADSDTNKDGLVNTKSFSKLVVMATSIPRPYGYVTTKMELYMTEDEREQAEGKMPDSMDFKGPNVITVDEWLQYRMKHIIAKAATPATHPILVQRSEEEFKAFADADNDRQGLPLQRGGRQRLLSQHRGQPDAAHNASSPTIATKGRQGPLPQHGDHKVLNLIQINKYFVPDDVYPHMAPTGNDGCVRGSLYAQADIPGPEEERGRTSGSLPNEADVPRPEEERGRNDDPLRVAEMGSPCHSSGCQKTRSKGLEEMMGGEGEKRK